MIYEAYIDDDSGASPECTTALGNADYLIRQVEIVQDDQLISYLMLVSTPLISACVAVHRDIYFSFL